MKIEQAGVERRLAPERERGEQLRDEESSQTTEEEKIFEGTPTPLLRARGGHDKTENTLACLRDEHSRWHSSKE